MEGTCPSVFYSRPHCLKMFRKENLLYAHYISSAFRASPSYFVEKTCLA